MQTRGRGTIDESTLASAQNRFSFDSQSSNDGQLDVSLRNRLRLHAMHLAANVQRYERFPKFWTAFTMLYRFCQNFSIFLLPSCSTVWVEGTQTGSFVLMIRSCFRFKVEANGVGEYARVDGVFFALAVLWISLLLRVIWRSPVTHSTSNAMIYFLRLLFDVLLPITSIWVASFSGHSFRAIRTETGGSGEHVLATLLVITMVLITCMRYIGCLLVHTCAGVDVGGWLRPCAMSVMKYAHLETYFALLAFLEGYLELNNTGERTVFIVMCGLIANPIVAAYLVYKPLFQDVNDTPHYVVQFLAAFAAMLVMGVKLLIVDIAPGTVLAIIIMMAFVSYWILKSIVNRKVRKCMKALYTVYKRTTAGLSRPLSSFGSKESQVLLLSNDAYAIVEAFDGLRIKGAAEFQYFLSVGTLNRMPAITNMDFIKWGMEQFPDCDSLVMCQQICEYFGGDEQTRHMLIQKIREMQHGAWGNSAMLYCMEINHADAIVDEPWLLKLLLTKARNSVVRCRRASSQFWGCVAKRSTVFMEEALCHVRDSRNDANVHFDELMRCYPFASATVALNLTFMTEIKGMYVDCMNYMTAETARYHAQYEMRSEETQVSAVVTDPTKLFATHTENINKHREHERLTQQGVGKMPGLIWAVTNLLAGTILLYLFIMLFTIEVSFAKHPALVDIIVSGNNANIDLVVLLLGMRRLCFRTSGLEDAKIEFPGCEKPAMTEGDQIVPWLTAISESASGNAFAFYKYASNYNWTAKGLIDNEIGMAGYGTRLYRVEGLGFIMDLWGSVGRNALTNTAKRFGDEMRGESNYEDSGSMYADTDFGDICLARETVGLMENMNALTQLVNSFGEYFLEVGKEISQQLNAFLYFSITCFPSICTILFSILLIVSVVFLLKENGFRLTLFLSLPEAIVSDLCKNGAIHREREDETYVNTEPERNSTCETTTVTTGTTTTTTTTTTTSSEMGPSDLDIWEAKRRIVEGLYHFSTGKIVNGIGVKQYIVWYIITLFVGVATFIVMGEYAKSVNDTLLSWSTKICYSMIRLMWTEMTMVCISDIFVAAVDTDLLLNRSMYELASVYGSQFQERARLLHRSLIYGDSHIKSDFRESRVVTNILTKMIPSDRPDEIRDQQSSQATVQHDGYSGSGADMHTELFFLATRSLIGMVEKEISQTSSSNIYTMWSSLNISTALWDEYEHLNAGHIVNELNSITLDYCDSSYNIIDTVIILTFGISLFVYIVLLLLIFGPLRVLTRSIYQYYDTIVHIIIQVPPEVFRSSSYISKWLKGDIWRHNYQEYRLIFNRSVPPEVQRGAVKECPEKIMLFNSHGKYVSTESSAREDFGEREPKTVADAISSIIDAPSGVKIIDDLDKTVIRFREARDSIGAVVMKASGAKGGYVQLTVTGIVSDEVVEAGGGTGRRYYDFIAILVRDITEELQLSEQFYATRLKNVEIMGERMPKQIAERFHDDLHDQKFVGEIVTVCVFRSVGFGKVHKGFNQEKFPEVVADFIKQCDVILSELPTISKLYIYGGNMMFVGGMFDEESTGQKEANEMIEFCMKMEQMWVELETQLSVKIPRSYAICTGGPVTYRLITTDASPQSMVSGRTVDMARVMSRSGEGLMIDQTTYHCTMDVGVVAEPLSDVRFNGEMMQRFIVTAAGASTSRIQESADPENAEDTEEIR